jgi:hypothetical protein
MGLSAVPLYVRGVEGVGEQLTLKRFCKGGEKLKIL